MRTADALPLDQAAGLRAPGPARHSWTVAVTSGKGGVGKTSLAVNLALAFAQTGQRPCLVDGDLGLANVDVLLNLHPRHSLGDVVSGAMALEEIVMPGPAGIQVIPAASGVEALANLAAPARRALRGRLEGLGALADVTILDTGAGLSQTVLSLVLASDEALVLTTPEPTALTDAYARVKVLTQRRPGLPLGLVVNLADSSAHAREVHGHLDRIIRRFLHREVPFLGWIPRDGCVERAVREQRPLALYFPYARATEAIRELAGTLGRRRPAEISAGFWQRLVESSEAS
ncbi:MAG TPA: MinD/ParA family protein [Candidatus Acidoferrum sp.]|nr:MinD/ParA family protein [Candidatus Acidoferrum sp.]